LLPEAKMIEIKFTNQRHLVLAIDGAVYEQARILISESEAELQTDSVGGDSFFEVTVLDSEVADEVIQHRFSDLSKEIMRIVLRPSLQLIKGETAIVQGIANRRGFVGVRGGYVGETNIAFNFYFVPDDWKRLWSIREYQQEFRQVFEREQPAGAQWTPEESRFDGVGDVEDRISLSFSLQDGTTTIQAEAVRHSGILTQLHETTVASLMSRLRQDSVVTYFNFPEEVRVPCEQYLLYFVQFLKDLGVEATAELQHEAGQVLFAVKPVNREGALDSIRTALNIYLQLPSNPISDSPGVEYEIAVQRLAANIEHLRGQIRLARAELRLAEATIQTQQVTINQLIGDDVISESMKDITPRPKDKDKEYLFGGIVVIKKYEGKGFDIDFSELFRKLRGLFKKKE
jgi:hypothetical protein